MVSLQHLRSSGQGKPGQPRRPLLLLSADPSLLPPAFPPAQVVKVKPHDKDAKLKYQECNKIVKQKAFERAIAGDEHKRSVVDSLDIESMSESGWVPTRPAQSVCIHTHRQGWP